MKKIEALTVGYKDKKQYYVDKLAEGIAMIASAFWPYEVIIRFSDFKTNEYNTLIGGPLYEPKEENPMIGWRGSSRYYDPKFSEAFGLECRAMKKVRETMGLVNVVPMIVFCRTVEEAKKVLAEMAKHGLKRGSRPVRQAQGKQLQPLKVYMMCEIPSNVILIDDFLKLFDGFSIGSNDLAQLTLGLDRDSGIIAHIANENNQAVKDLIKIVIQKCNQKKKYIGKALPSKLRLEQLKDESKLHIQKVGLVKFNPFNETGGDHSFSLALLDGNKNGIIITSLHTRERTRFYLKEVKSGKSLIELSEDEAKALKESVK